MEGYGNMNLYCCLLCYQDVDSHAHLFFECKYSGRVWALVRNKLKISGQLIEWDVILQYFILISCNSIDGVVGRLLLAASVYHIWKERNQRLSSCHTRSPESLYDSIID
jgi:hypothetical protein